MAEGFFFSGDEGNLSSRRRLADMLMKQGNTPIQSRHWMEDAANAARGVLGAYISGKTDAEQAKIDRDLQSVIMGSLGGAPARPDAVSGGAGNAATAPAPGSDRPFRTNDPVASDLPPQARAFLNAIAGGESSGRYNVRYDGSARGATFGDFSQHPGIMAPGPHGPSSAAGRYQFTRTTWDGMGGGNFSPENQDRRAWELAQRDYRARTNRDLGADLQSGGLTPQILQTLAPTWRAFEQNQGRHIATFQESMRRYQAAGASPQQAAAMATQDAQRAPKEDTVDGGDGSPAGLLAPDLAGSFDMMRRAAPGPQDPRARAFDQITRSAAGRQPLQLLQPEAVPEITVGGTPEQPMMAPLPVARPVVPEAPASAPIPMARPNIEPPANAQPAVANPQLARALGLSERDRIMLGRDEASLAPGEAEALRAQLPGQPNAPAAPAAAPAANPLANLRQMLMGGNSVPAAAQAPAAAPSPSAASAAAPTAPVNNRAALLAIMMNRNASPQAQRAAMLAYQESDPNKQETNRLAVEAARLANQQAQRTLNAPLPNSPEALQAQTRARETEADRLGIQGQARQRYVLTGQLPDQSSENIPTQVRTREQEAQRLGLRPGTPEYQNYALTGKFRDSPELSSADRKAIMEAEDQVPVIQNTLTQLQRARELNRQAYSGALAGVGAAIGTSGIPGAGLIADPKRAEASREFNQIMSGQAVEQMSAILKGATTDREMAQFKEILGNPSTPPDIRERTIDRMLQLAQRQLELQQNRVQQLRGRDYFRPNGGQTPAAAPQAAPAPSGVPPVGEVRRGYRFKGGDPSKQENWERVQ